MDWLPSVLPDVYLALPLYIANHLLFPIFRWRLLGKLHRLDSPVSAPLFGKQKTWLGLAAILLLPTMFYSPLLGKLCLLPGIGMALGVHANSFIKRRLGIRDRGLLPIADQLDFFLGGASGLALCGYYFSNFPLMLAITFAFHLSTNVAAWILKLKDNWY